MIAEEIEAAGAAMSSAIGNPKVEAQSRSSSSDESRTRESARPLIWSAEKNRGEILSRIESSSSSSVSKTPKAVLNNRSEASAITVT